MTLESNISVSESEYTIGGRKYPRMTRVLDVIAKPEFYRWYAKNGYSYCQNYMNDRAAFGTRCHSEFEHVLKGMDVWCDNDEMEETVRAFDVYRRQHEIEPFVVEGQPALEVQLHNDELGVAGTCDFAGWCDGNRYILDWKTSKAVYDNYLLQVSGYLYMYEQKYDTVMDGAGVIAVHVYGEKDDLRAKIKTKFISREECMKHLEVFKAAVQIYNWKYNKGAWERTKTKS